MKITLGNTLPPYPDFVEGIRRTHDRGYTLVPVQAKLSPAVTCLLYTSDAADD